MSDELLQRFIIEVDRRLASIENKVDSLSEFKLQTVATARLTSLVVSAACGFITMIATVTMAWFSKP